MNNEPPPAEDRVVGGALSVSGPPLEVGAEYLVVAVGFHTKPTYFGSGVIFEVDTERSYRIVLASAQCFSIIDNRASSLWRFFAQSDSVSMLAPELLAEQYIYDDLSNRVPEVMRRYDALIRFMKHEFDGDDQEQ